MKCYEMQMFHTHSTEKTYSIEKISTKWLVLSWEKFAFCTNNAVKIYYFFVWNHNLINSIVNGTIVHFQCFHIVTALRIVNSFFFFFIFICQKLHALSTRSSTRMLCISDCPCNSFIWCCFILHAINWISNNSNDFKIY